MGTTARVLVRKDVEPFIVVIAESVKKDPWWLYHTLIGGGDSLETHQVDDVDNFAVYDFITKKLVVMIGDGKWAHVFRIHDNNRVSIFKKADTEAGVTVLKKSDIFGGLHRCEGKAHSGCGEEFTIKLDSMGLQYRWALPDHLRYENAKDFKWVTPKPQ